LSCFFNPIFSGAGKFNTLLATVEKVGLTETLSTGGPFTVFAPTDKAFAELAKTKNLSATPLDQLKKVIRLCHLNGVTFLKILRQNFCRNLGFFRIWNVWKKSKLS
jgi:uncharacterized surface protein with fasciclin (FAS1) repeats